MSELTPVTMYTVPSTYVGPYYSIPLKQPYQRIVGLSYVTDMPEGLWTPENTKPILNYAKRDAEPLVIDMPFAMAEKLGSFFTRFHVQGPEVKYHGHKSEYAVGGNEAYSANCHRFGYWMRGSIVASGRELPEAPDFVASEGFKVTPPVAMGKHSVLGNGAAIHSVVGLGTDRDICLEVVGLNGPLGIDTYENVLKFYDPDGIKSFAFYI